MLKTLNSQRTILQIINEYSNFIARIEVEIFLSHIFNCTRMELYIKDFPIIDEEAVLGQCDSFIERRLAGEPLQYIIGWTEFMGLDFVVNKDVFIPRPETEILVNEVLISPSRGRLNVPYLVGRDFRILDLCTGCGNIAISIARSMPEAEIVGTDISKDALNTAQKNANIHNVDKNIAFYKGDIFNALSLLPMDRHRFDIIVCNPPYIKTTEISSLQKEVGYEPKIALDGGYDGLEFYRRIAKSAPDYLRQGGSLFLEIGFNQTQDVKDIWTSEKVFGINSIKKDFGGIDRVIWISLL